VSRTRSIRRALDQVPLALGGEQFVRQPLKAPGRYHIVDRAASQLLVRHRGTRSSARENGAGWLPRVLCDQESVMFFVGSVFIAIAGFIAFSIWRSVRTSNYDELRKEYPDKYI
jgi:hypothetical protein